MYTCAEGAYARTDTGLLPVLLFPLYVRDSPLRLEETQRSWFVGLDVRCACVLLSRVRLWLGFNQSIRSSEEPLLDGRMSCA